MTMADPIVINAPVTIPPAPNISAPVTIPPARNITAPVTLGYKGDKGDGFRWRGEWTVPATLDPSPYYLKRDVVISDGSVYVAVADHDPSLESTPGLPSGWWELMVSKGEKGDQGIQGLQGLQGLRGETGAPGSTTISGISGLQDALDSKAAASRVLPSTTAIALSVALG